MTNFSEPKVDSSVLTALSVRCEEATDYDGSIEKDIFLAFNPEYSGWIESYGSWRHPNDGSDMRTPPSVRTPNYLGNTDTAMLLIPGDFSIRITGGGKLKWSAAVFGGSQGAWYPSANCKTRQYAICGAVLKAHAALLERNK